MTSDGPHIAETSASDPRDSHEPPNVDVASVRTVRCGNYQVAVGRMDDGRHVAQVVKSKRTGLSKAMASAFGRNPEWYSVTDAPEVTHDAKWTAVGSAVEAYLEQDDIEDETHD